MGFRHDEKAYMTVATLLLMEKIKVNHRLIEHFLTTVGFRLTNVRRGPPTAHRHGV
jgi:hypothetical protein